MELIDTRRIDTIEQNLKTTYIVRIKVNLPVNMPVGLCQLELAIENCPRKLFSVFVLYNPWNKDDITYCNNVDSYVLQNYTYFATGIEPSSITTIFWQLDQFHQKFIEFVIDLLKHIQENTRLDILLLCRTIAIMLWSDSKFKVFTSSYYQCEYIAEDIFEIGLSTLDIILKFYQYNKKPIIIRNSGIISCFYLSIIRFLGVPSQIVTCFMCNHNNYANSMEKNRIYNQDGMFDSSNNNFAKPYHCWIEISLNSPLQTKFVINVVPQFNQKYLSNIGPTSLSNLKHAQFDEYYDTNYFYNALNAFIVQKMCDNILPSKNILKVKNILRDNFGWKLCVCDSYDGNIYDVTSYYKFNPSHHLKNLYQYKLYKCKILNKNKESIKLGTFTTITNTLDSLIHKYHLLICKKTNSSLSFKLTVDISIVNEWDEFLIGLYHTFKHIKIDNDYHFGIDVKMSTQNIYELFKLKNLISDQFYVKFITTCLIENGEIYEQIKYIILTLWNIKVEYPEFITENVPTIIKISSTISIPTRLINPVLTIYSHALDFIVTKQLKTLEPNQILNECISFKFHKHGHFPFICFISCQNHIALYGHVTLVIMQENNANVYTPNNE